MRKLTNKYNLLVLNPTLARQWHPARNGKLKPRDVTPFSHKRIWWVCSKGHKWQASVATRSEGHGCPYCSGLYVSKDNNLKKVNPKLAKEWHPVKNRQLTPRDFTAGSKQKVWWLCKKGHEWNAMIRSRNGGSGCPYCTNQKVCKDNCLQTLKPSLAKEWHAKKNGKLTPRDVVPNSHFKVWWQCSAGHVWQATVNSRNYGTGCKRCSMAIRYKK